MDSDDAVERCSWKSRFEARHATDQFGEHCKLHLVFVDNPNITECAEAISAISFANVSERGHPLVRGVGTD